MPLISFKTDCIPRISFDICVHNFLAIFWPSVNRTISKLQPPKMTISYLHILPSFVEEILSFDFHLSVLATTVPFCPELKPFHRVYNLNLKEAIVQFYSSSPN